MKKKYDIGSIIIILITFTLFVIALFVKGFTHDLLLEAGVFLVSVKLIVMNYKHSVNSRELKKDLKLIKRYLEEKNT